MLIPFTELQDLLTINNIIVTGCFHIGAHNCEELPMYNDLGVSNENMIWIDGIKDKVDQATDRGIPNVYNVIISDKDDEDVVFNISNNCHSSSILEFGTHTEVHPWVVFVDKIYGKTLTINSFFDRNNIDGSKYNFWNFDIQGAELMALHGAGDYIKYVDVMYLEVNEKELYKNCGLIDELDSFLSRHNFKRVITKMTEYGWGDAIYIKNI